MSSIPLKCTYFTLLSYLLYSVCTHFTPLTLLYVSYVITPYSVHVLIVLYFAGSMLKIDASYLSPNVNMAARLESGCDQFEGTNTHVTSISQPPDV